MKIYDGEMSDAQVQAGLAIMKGTRRFDITLVTKALSDAGVENCFSGAEALIGRELKQGHIRRITRGIYEWISN